MKLKLVTLALAFAAVPAHAAMGTAPVLVEPFTGTITFAWSGRPTLHTLGPDGTPTSTLPVKPAGRGWWRVVLDSTVRSAG